MLVEPCLQGYCYKNNDAECAKIKRDIPEEAPTAKSIDSHEKAKYFEEQQHSYKDIPVPSKSTGLCSDREIERQKERDSETVLCTM